MGIEWLSCSCDGGKTVGWLDSGEGNKAVWVEQRDAADRLAANRVG